MPLKCDMRRQKSVFHKILDWKLFSADAVWRLAREQAARAEVVDFTAWRAAHGLSMTEAAHNLGLSRRVVAYYESGAKPVPRLVALALKGFDAQSA